MSASVRSKAIKKDMNTDWLLLTMAIESNRTKIDDERRRLPEIVAPWSVKRFYCLRPQGGKMNLNLGRILPVAEICSRFQLVEQAADEDFTEFKVPEGNALDAIWSTIVTGPVVIRRNGFKCLMSLIAGIDGWAIWFRCWWSLYGVFFIFGPVCCRCRSGGSAACVALVVNILDPHGHTASRSRYCRTCVQVWYGEDENERSKTGIAASKGAIGRYE